MTRNFKGLWLIGTVAALFAMGCGETSGTDGGTGCTTDANCGTGKVCHPVLKECITSCTGSSDCPASAKTCARFDGTAGSASSPGFCQCSTDQLCNGGMTGALVCSEATKRCENKCTSNSNCPSGYTCETSTGQCKGGGGSDAGMDAGTMDAGMTTCNSSNTQPDVCGHTNVCTSANTCEAITDGTCSNITMATRTPFTSASTGPVIFNVVDEMTDDDTFCAAGTTAFTSTIYAYAAVGSMFGTTGSGLPAGSYYLTDGSAQTIQGKFRPSGYTQLAGGAMMSLKVTLCSPTAMNQLVAGFGFDNGNGYCVTIQR